MNWFKSTPKGSPVPYIRKEGNLPGNLPVPTLSNEEQWQPKNILVTFRMYQLNLDGNESQVFKKYWDTSTVHFIEKDLESGHEAHYNT